MKTPLQGAFLGFGNIAEKGHAPAYEADAQVEIVAALEPSPARQVAAQVLFPGIRLYSTVEDLFRTEKLDFVDICTPPVAHANLAIQALRHGAHVLCEKPLALGSADFEIMAKEASRQNRTLYTVHNWKYAPIFQKTKALIQEGRIGSVWHVEIFVQRNSHCKGTPTGATATDGKSEDWRMDAAVAGGGILVDHGWHSFYLMLNLLEKEPEKLLAKMLMPVDKPTGLEEAVQTLIQFPDADAYIHLTWRAPVRRNAIMIQGLTGTILIDDDRILLNTTQGLHEEINFPKALSAGSHHADWFAPLLADFLDEVHNPARRGANLREAGWCMALTSAAYESNLRGFQEVPVNFPGARRVESFVS